MNCGNGYYKSVPKFFSPLLITKKHKHKSVQNYNFASRFVWAIEKNQMGGACGAYRGGDGCAQCSGGET